MKSPAPDHPRCAACQNRNRSGQTLCPDCAQTQTQPTRERQFLAIEFAFGFDRPTGKVRHLTAYTLPGAAYKLTSELGFIGWSIYQNGATVTRDHRVFWKVYPVS